MRQEVIRSEIFRISRMQLVRIAAWHYVRRFWPIFIAFPVFGPIAVLFGSTPILRAVGAFATLWPISIPARAIFLTRGAARRLGQETWVSIEEGTVYFHDPQGGGTRIDKEAIRTVATRDEFLVIETKRFNIALIPLAAIDDPFRAALAEVVA